MKNGKLTSRVAVRCGTWLDPAATKLPCLILVFTLWMPCFIAVYQLGRLILGKVWRRADAIESEPAKLSFAWLSSDELTRASFREAALDGDSDGP